MNNIKEDLVDDWFILMEETESMKPSIMYDEKEERLIAEKLNKVIKSKLKSIQKKQRIETIVSNVLIKQLNHKKNIYPIVKQSNVTEDIGEYKKPITTEPSFQISTPQSQSQQSQQLTHRKPKLSEPIMDNGSMEIWTQFKENQTCFTRTKTCLVIQWKILKTKCKQWLKKMMFIDE